MNQKHRHQRYKLMAGILILGFSTLLSIHNPTKPAVLGDIVDANKEISLSQFGGEEQYIISLKTPAIGGDGIGNAPSSSMFEEKVEDIKEGVKERNKEILADSQGEELSKLPIITANLSPGEAEEIRQDPFVANASVSKMRFASLDTSLPVIRADEAHDSGFEGDGYAVAVIDTGVDNTHPFLDVISEACYSNSGGFGGGTSLCPNGQPEQTGTGAGDNCTGISGCDHGTHVAGIAAGNSNGGAYNGVADKAKIISIQVFTTYSTSTCMTFFGYSPCLGASDSDILAGLNRVLELATDPGFTTPIASVNMSLGGGLYSSQTSCDISTASYISVIQNLRDLGIATVIASGNEGSGTHISSPGCASNAIAVGSTTDSDTISGFSNGNSMLDLLAPGSGINSSISGGSYGSKSGTSMATPHIAGTFAVLKQANPNATVDELLTTLKNTGKPITDSRNSLNFKRADVMAAVDETAKLVQIDVTDTTTSEDGETAKVQFSLSSQPSANITIPLSISDATEATLGATSSITITPANWDTPANNEITITGLDDASKDGHVSFTLVTGDPTSSDTLYNNLTASDVMDPIIKNLDNEDVPLSDMNNDGFDDGLIYRQRKNGTILTQSLKGSSAGYNTAATNNYIHVSWYKIKTLGIGDIDGDNYDDNVFLYNAGKSKTQVYAYKGKPSGTSSQTKVLSSNIPIDIAKIRAGGVADFNRDGYEDLMFFEQKTDGKTRSWVAYGSSEGMSAFELHQNLNWDWVAIDVIGTGDMNGDKFDDLQIAKRIGADDTQFYTFYGSNSGLGNNTLNINNFWPALSTINGSGIADFNNDTYADGVLLKSGENGAAWIYTGNGSASGITSYTLKFKTSLKWKKLRTVSLGDVNGDGYQDLTLLYGLPSGDSRLYTIYGSSSGLTSLNVRIKYFPPSVYAIRQSNE